MKKPHKISLVICTRNRSEMLARCLEKLKQVRRLPYSPIEIVLVDNNSTDDTMETIKNFQASYQGVSKMVEAKKTGLGHARNCGIQECSGDMIMFTDDDCFLPEDFLINFFKSCDLNRFQYGMGSIWLANEEDDHRVANMKIERESLIPPGTAVLPAGIIQGANMFFAATIFETAGLFNEDMGAGTKFPCEDIEMACRASHSGFTGAMLPGFGVFHAHGRRRDSAEALQTIHSYDYGRGAYYASLLTRGVPEVWSFWQNSFTHERFIAPQNLDRVAREFAGATQYLQFLMRDKNDQTG